MPQNQPFESLSSSASLRREMLSKHVRLTVS